MALRPLGQGNHGSYGMDVREMLANRPPRELLPHVWLERLRNECTANDFAILGPGTCELDHLLTYSDPHVLMLSRSHLLY